MKFQFQLQRMLQLVEMKEDAQKMQVALVNSKLTRLSGARDDLESTINELLRRQSDLGVSLSWADYGNSKISLNLESLENLNKEILVTRQKLENENKVLAGIVMKRKALESLRDKRKSEFKRNMNKKEQKMIEELFRYARSKRA